MGAQRPTPGPKRAVYPAEGLLESLLADGLGPDEEAVKDQLMEPRLRSLVAKAYEEGRVTGPYRCPVCGMRAWKQEYAAACCDGLVPGATREFPPGRHGKKLGSANNTNSRWEQHDPFGRSTADPDDYEL